MPIHLIKHHHARFHAKFKIFIWISILKLQQVKLFSMLVSGEQLLSLPSANFLSP